MPTFREFKGSLWKTGCNISSARPAGTKYRTYEESSAVRLKTRSRRGTKSANHRSDAQRNPSSICPFLAGGTRPAVEFTNTATLNGIEISVVSGFASRLWRRPETQIGLCQTGQFQRDQREKQPACNIPMALAGDGLVVNQQCSGDISKAVQALPVF